MTTVIDLRSPGEVAAEGPGPLTRLPDVRHAYHPGAGRAAAAATDAAAGTGAGTGPAADALAVRREGALARYPGDAMTGHYLGYLEHRPAEVVAALRAVAQAPGAALVHCAAGKDRTGVVVALALSAVGVRRDAIVADYAASGERVDAILARLRSSSTYAADINSRPDSDHQARAADHGGVSRPGRCPLRRRG